MIEEESDDTDAVVKLLELNDIINVTVERYTLTKKGNLDAARALPLISSQSPPPFAESSSSTTAVETSLIDLDSDLNGGSGPSAPSIVGKTGSLEDDLLGLSFQDNGPFGQGGGIALGFGANTGKLIACRNIGADWKCYLGIPGPPLLSTTVQTNTAGQQQQITPSASPAPHLVQQTRSIGFPDYSSALHNSAIPAAQQSGLLPTLSSPPPQQYRAPAPQQSNGSSFNNDDDEWAFTSALPPGSDAAPPPPARNELVILNSNLHILLEVNRPVTMPDGPILVKAKFSNNNGQPIQDLTFQMAVTRVSVFFVARGSPIISDP